LWSELRFRLRRSSGILTGTIDKLLITPAGNGINVEIIDFKTNRFSGSSDNAGRKAKTVSVTASRVHVTAEMGQAAFDFEAATEEATVVSEPARNESLDSQIDKMARDYRLQMQAYALALQELLPRDARINSLRATLHFIHPNIEKILSAEFLDRETCARAVDEAILQLVSLDGTVEAEDFPTLANAHCLTCSFLDFCAAGQDWLRRY